MLNDTDMEIRYISDRIDELDKKISVCKGFIEGYVQVKKQFKKELKKLQKERNSKHE